MFPASTAVLYLAIGFGTGGSVMCNSCSRVSGFDGMGKSPGLRFRMQAMQAHVIRCKGNEVKRRGYEIQESRGYLSPSPPSTRERKEPSPQASPCCRVGLTLCSSDDGTTLSTKRRRNGAVLSVEPPGMATGLARLDCMARD